MKVDLKRSRHLRLPVFRQELSMERITPTRTFLKVCRHDIGVDGMNLKSRLCLLENLLRVYRVLEFCVGCESKNEVSVVWVRL